MSTVIRPGHVPGPRDQQMSPTSDRVIVLAHDRRSHSLHVRSTDVGAPSYLEGGTAAAHSRSVAFADVPEDDPNATAPATAAIFNLQAYPGAVFHWRNVAGGDRTNLDVEFWVQADAGVWLLVAGQSQANSTELTEYSVARLGYRRVFARVTGLDAGGGNGATVTLHAAGS